VCARAVEQRSRKPPGGRFPVHRAAVPVSLPLWMRTALLAATAAVVFAVVSATAADAGSSPWGAYLAPGAACPGAEDVGASPQVQKRAMLCLVNWTRRRAGLRSLHWSRMLANAAGSKADVIAHCADFSHHPCGTRWPAAVIHTRYKVWGENLYFGSRPIASPRSAVLAWLESPEHRAILLGRPWRDLGVTVQRARALGGDARVSIWVLEVAGRV
jgi:uncharacterized protein YkwD